MILGIYGAGGLGREVYEIAIRRNTANFLWDQIVFIDDNIDEGDFFGTIIIHFDSLKKQKNEYECIIAVGEPLTREKLFRRLTDENIKLTSLIDPTATVSPTAKIGNGTIICEYSTIHTGVELGNNVLIQPYCTLGHDIMVGNHSVLSTFCAPGGGAVFGERVFVGMQSTIIGGLSIGDDAIISMGAAVFRDIPVGATVVGNPARITRGNNEHRALCRLTRAKNEL